MTKLNYGLVCDYASFSEGGKLNILGIFKNINAVSIPFTHPQLFIVVNISVEKEGKYKEMIKLVRKKDNVEIMKPLEFDLFPKSISEKKIELGVVGQMTNIKFEKSGEYVFKIFLNNDFLGEVPFYITEIK